MFGFIGLSTFELNSLWLGSNIAMSMFSLYLLFDLKRSSMSKNNRITIVKSLEYNSDKQELELTTVQNYKNYESINRIPIDEIKVSGEFMEPSDLEINFHKKQCKLSV